MAAYETATQLFCQGVAQVEISDVQEDDIKSILLTQEVSIDAAFQKAHIEMLPRFWDFYSALNEVGEYDYYAFAVIWSQIWAPK
mmetsp:Transcript_4448/g.7589  ORF Transcript_4448/g.7589 Transcript_4448/m.7589 type:complete len:84 (+) Transcript_4448:634-885(+)